MPNKKLDRAKQFMPFDALKGFNEALREKEKVYDRRVVLAEDKVDEINKILSSIKINDYIEITYYSDGKYNVNRLKVKKLAFKVNKLYINDKVIYFKDLKDVKIID